MPPAVKWTSARDDVVRRLYADLSLVQQTVLDAINALPGLRVGTWDAVKARAQKLGIRREMPATPLAPQRSAQQIAAEERRAALATQVRDLAAQGLLLTEIEAEIGVSNSMIRRIAQEHDIRITTLAEKVAKVGYKKVVYNPTPKAQIDESLPWEEYKARALQLREKQKSWEDVGRLMALRPFQVAYMRQRFPELNATRVVIGIRYRRQAKPKPREIVVRTDSVEEWLRHHEITRCPLVAAAPTTAEIPEADRMELQRIRDERDAFQAKAWRERG